jgi:hypothetical protein
VDTRRNLSGVFAHALRAAVSDLRESTMPSGATNGFGRSSAESRDNAMATIVAIAEELDQFAKEPVP